MSANDHGGMPDPNAQLIQTPLRADETDQPLKPEQPAKKSFRNVAATEAHIRTRNLNVGLPRITVKHNAVSASGLFLP